MKKRKTRVLTTLMLSTVLAVSTGASTVSAYSWGGGFDWGSIGNIGSTQTKTFTIAYNSNGGNGSMGNSSLKSYGSVSLRKNTFTREGYEFSGWFAQRSSDSKWYTSNGWYTDAEISSKGYTKYVYADGESVSNLSTVNGDTITFFAQWNEVAVEEPVIPDPEPVPDPIPEPKPEESEEVVENYSNPKLNSISVDGGIKLTWSSVDGVNNYRVYRRADGGTWSAVEDVNGTSYVEKSTSLSGRYFYSVSCLSKNGKEVSGYDTNGLSVVYAPSSGDLSIEDGDKLVYFAKSSYKLNPISINGVNDLTVDFNGADITVSGDCAFKAEKCNNIKLLNGKIHGTNLLGMDIVSCKSPVVENCEIYNIGGKSYEATSGIRLFGNCTGFKLLNNKVHDISAGVVSSDKFIHAYGIQLNRFNSNKAFSTSGIIQGCKIYNVAGIDTSSTKADGDGIFLNAPPYKDDNGNIKWYNCGITIKDCTFESCKKRGVKATTDGVTITNCTFTGDYWYAPIDLQFGHCTVDNCKISNTSGYNNSVTSGIVASDGGFTIKNCTISAPYKDSNGKQLYHPGIRMTERMSWTVIPKSESWDECVIESCTFDQISRAVYAYTGNTKADVYTLDGLTFNNCTIGTFNQAYPIEIKSSKFNKTGFFTMKDYKFKAGSTADAVKKKNSGYKGPYYFDVKPSKVTVSSKYMK